MASASSLPEFSLIAVRSFHKGVSKSCDPPPAGSDRKVWNGPGCLASNRLLHIRRVAWRGGVRPVTVGPAHPAEPNVPGSHAPPRPAHVSNDQVPYRDQKTLDNSTAARGDSPARSRAVP